MLWDLLMQCMLHQLLPFSRLHGAHPAYKTLKYRHLLQAGSTCTRVRYRHDMYCQITPYR